LSLFLGKLIDSFDFTLSMATLGVLKVIGGFRTILPSK
jgi:hypothetical protein